MTSAENPPPSDTSDPDAIRADIEATRADLAETVDALSDKLNVKSQASNKVGEVKTKVSDAASHAKASAPQPVQDALDTVGAKAGPVAHQVNVTTQPHRGKIIAGVAVGLVLLIVLRRRGAST